MIDDDAAVARTIDQDAVESARIYGERHGISGKIHPKDYIFWYIHENAAEKPMAEIAVEYLSSGAGVVELLRNLLNEYRAQMLLDAIKDPAEPISVLEFAAGYGRVTRHFPGMFPAAKVTGCDIHQEAVDFLNEIGFDAVKSSHHPATFKLDGRYHVIFAFSFFTHMPRSTWTAWLRSLSDHLVDGGLLVFTCHGELSQQLMRVPALDEDGFFFHPVSEQKDLELGEYGNTVTAFDYVNTQIRHLGLRLISFRQAGAGHHDVYIVQKSRDAIVFATDKDAELRTCRDESETLRNQLHQAVLNLGTANSRHVAAMDAMVASTSWKVTSGIRALSRMLRRPR